MKLKSKAATGAASCNNVASGLATDEVAHNQCNAAPFTQFYNCILIFFTPSVAMTEERVEHPAKEDKQADSMRLSGFKLS